MTGGNGLPLEKVAGTTPYYYHANQLGSIQDQAAEGTVLSNIMTLATKSVADLIRYKPWLTGAQAVQELIQGGAGYQDSIQPMGFAGWLNEAAGVWQVLQTGPDGAGVALSKCKK